MKKFVAPRGLIALLVTLTMALGFAAPAYAVGTFTSMSFTASAPYTATGASNARYDWGFTTAATNPIQTARMSVPAGTSGSNLYLDLSAVSGTSGNYASTPDSTQNSLSGDIDMRALIAPNHWSGTYQTIMAKNDTKEAYQFYISTSGILALQTSADGTSWIDGSSTVNPPGADGQPLWVRATRQMNNGSSGNTTTFYTSTDGSSWTQLGSPNIQAGVTSIFNSSDKLEVGTVVHGTANRFAGKIYYAEVDNGIGGSIINSFDPSLDAVSATSWTSASATAETWTINRTVTTAFPADISSDLVASNITGLGIGGTARLRTIDEVAVYTPPTYVSVAAGTAITISLQGFTNTSTAGSYSSTIYSYDNSIPPVPIDTGTTSTLTFADVNDTATVAVAVDPSISFTVAGRSSVCNSQSATNFQTSATATAISLGHLSASTVGGGAQDLTVVSNASQGVTVYLRTSGTTPNAFRSGSDVIADVSGTRASPGSAPVAGTPGFGFTSSDVSTAFTSNTWAKLTNTNDSVVILAPGTMSKSACVGYEGAVAATTVAGNYSVTVVYTAVPVF